jgi:hypothetical protein
MTLWIDREFAGVDFGDTRLDDRLRMVVEARFANPGASIPGAFSSRAETEAAYRLYANPSVSPELILESHLKATGARAQERDLILVVQDTTEIDLTRPKERVGGPLDGANRRGMLAHGLIAFTPEGLPLGLVDASIWKRPEPRPQRRKRAELAARLFEEKESYRWLAGYEQTCAFKEELPPETRVVALSDSEGDIYECMVAAQNRRTARPASGANFIIRACQNRSIANESELLFQAVASTPALGTYSLDVRARSRTTYDDRKRKQARKARVAKMTIRAAEVQLAPPSKKEKLPHVAINAVLISEDKPPDGEVPITWLLLTDLPIATAAEIEAIIRFYLCRWNVEVYFRALKGGCHVEDLQLESDQGLMNCIAVYMIVAWRLLYLTMLGRACPDLPCEVAFDRAEWQAAFAVTHRRALPAKPPTMKEMLQMVAALGGFTGRGKNAAPGVKSIWIGVQRLKDIACGWEAAQRENAVSSG